MSKRNGKREPRPDLRPFGVVVGEEEDGSLFDLGRYGELEALGVDAANRANKARDELIRRATIIMGRLDRTTTIEDIKTRGAGWLRSIGLEYVLEPKRDIFVLYSLDEQGQRQTPNFWIFMALHVLQPGGYSPVMRMTGDDPIAGVQLRIGGSPWVIGEIQDEAWHSNENTIWSGDDDTLHGRDGRDAEAGNAGEPPDVSNAAPRQGPTGEGAA